MRLGRGLLCFLWVGVFGGRGLTIRFRRRFGRGFRGRRVWVFWVRCIRDMVLSAAVGFRRLLCGCGFCRIFCVRMFGLRSVCYAGRLLRRIRRCMGFL